MPSFADLEAIAAARRRVDEISREEVEVAAQLSKAEQALLDLERQGVAPSDLAAAGQRLDRLRADREGILQERTARDEEVRRHREALVDGVEPEQLVAQLDSQLPVVLLPVRLETRFFDDGRQLRVRVFPDTIHVHTHEPELTETEQSFGRDYWSERWAIGGDAERDRGAWRVIAGRFGPARAAWIAGQLMPTNLGDLGGSVGPSFPDRPIKGAAWSQPPSATVLPDRWAAIGIRQGREIFRKWGNQIPDALAFGPTPDPTGDILAEGEPARVSVEPDLPTDEAMRWMIDYSEAERVGMAITVTNRDLVRAQLADGIDRLIVIGLDWTRTPEASAELLGDLFEAQLHTEGMAVLRQGTPTNNTGTERSGYVSNESDLLDALDPALVPAHLGPSSNARRLATALGLPGDRDVFDRLPHAGLAENDNASHMNNALWEATWGYFFDHLVDGVVTDAQASQLRDHFRKYVRGRGPLPALRVGDQPYGVLPVVAADRWRSRGRGPIDGLVMRLIDDLRGLWSAAAERSPRMGRTDDPGQDLLAILQHTPTASSMRFRTVFGPLYVANTQGMEQLTSLQELTGRWMMAMVGAEASRPRLAASVVNPHFRALTLPFVQTGATSEEEGLTTNYISSIAARLGKVGGFVAVRKDDPRSLLHALLRHGAELEMGKASTNLITQFKFPRGARPPKIASGPEPELVDVESATKDSDTSVRIAERRVRAISGNRTLANHIATLKAPSRRRATRSFASFRASLESLSRLPSADLERLLLEALDCSSHRLDAWLTSFATKRLDELRSARAKGAYLGSFGWVEDLRPDATPDSLGYVHTPSMAHAATAAILRSGHLSHAENDASPLATNLSSSRVREAMRLMEGVRQGQPIGALLGYRFERALREHKPLLARYILSFRTVAPLATSEDVVSENGPIEAVAARDVVDGVRLLEKWKLDEASLFDAAGVASSDRGHVRAVLERLDDRLDSVADVLVSESVYQSVLGNLDRAGAATAALDRQAVPPEPDIVRTPRTGEDYVNRLAVIVRGGVELPASWGDAPLDPRAVAEPRLNAWAAAMLGDPARFRFVAAVLDDEGSVMETLEARMTDLPLSPLSILEATGTGGSGEATELEELLAAHFSLSVTDPDRATELRLLSGRLASWPRSAVSLGELIAISGSLWEVVSQGRPLDPTDVELPEERTPPVIDVPELTSRADKSVAAAQNALDQITTALAANPPSAAQLRGGLELASAAGAPGAVPVALGSGDDDKQALTEQAELVSGALNRALEAAARAAADPGIDGSVGLEVAAQVARIKAVFGGAFPVAPLVTLSNGPEASASLEDAPALTGGDDLAAATWLQRMALVQPGAARLSRALSYAEMSGADAAAQDLVVIQIPHRPGDSWVAMEQPAGGPAPSGRISIVAHAHRGIDVMGPLAGIVVDDWLETVPNRVETTGVAFHYDAPAARAPQAVLVAVPPDPDLDTWSFDALADTVLEAHDLAKIRAVDPQEIWLAGRFLPALYVAHNVARDTASINFFALQAREDDVALGDG